MKKTPLLILAIWIAALAVSPAFAAEESDRELVQTYVNFYLSSKDTVSAQRALEDHLASDPQDSAAWNTLGLLHQREKRVPEALKAFQKAATPIAQYNAADTLVQASQTEESQELLKKISEDPAVGRAARQALKEMVAGQSLPALYLEEPMQLNFSGSLGVGNDSNVLMTADSLLSTQEASGTGSLVVTPGILVKGYKSYGKLAIAGRFDSGFAHHLNAPTQTLNAWVNNLYLDFQPWNLELNTNLSFLNTNGFGFYNFTPTLAWHTTQDISRHANITLSLPVRYAVFAGSGSSDPEDSRTGIALSPQGTYKTRCDSMDASIGMQLDWQFTGGANFRAMAYRLPMQLNKFKFFGPNQLHFGVEPALVLFPSAAVARRDVALNLSLGISRALAPRLMGQLKADFTRNASTLATAQYSRAVIGLVVNYDFL